MKAITISFIFLVILSADCFGKEIKCGDKVKIISFKDSSEFKGVLEHKDSDLIGVYNQYKGIRFFDTGEVLHAYICKGPNKKAVQTSALIDMLVGGTTGYLLEWPRKRKEEVRAGIFYTEVYYETDPWVILAGIISGGLLGTVLGFSFDDYVEVKTDDLFGIDPGRGGFNTGKSYESIILSVKLKL